MRLFIAVELSETMKNVLCDAMQFLRASGVAGGYTRRDNLHLTLAFIGECESADAICSVMDGISVQPFDIVLDGYGSFGDTLWAGIRKNTALSELAERLRDRLSEAGFEMERRPYKPHVTLVRKASRREKLNLHIPDACMRVDGITLMRSERIDGRLVYTPVYKKML